MAPTVRKAYDADRNLFGDLNWRRHRTDSRGNDSIRTIGE
jgi:hypothetical protein